MTGTAPTNFPTGFVGSYTMFGCPAILPGPALPASTKYLFVNSVTGATGNPGTFEQPFDTVDRAMDFVVADSNFVIVCLPGHAQTITAAAGVTMDVAGVSVIGLGTGNDRPRFTFTTSTAASWLVSAANCMVSNIVGIAGIDGLTQPFHIQGARFQFLIEWQDASSTVEAARAMLTTTAADGLNGCLTFRGFTAGNANVNAIRLVATNDARLYVDYYGVLTTAVVEFTGTASTNAVIGMTAYTSGVTDQSRLVVDTITGSTWYAYGYDTTASQPFSGGSASAIAIAPSISAVTDALYGANGIATWPAAAQYANNVSIAEVLGWIQDGVRRGTGTAMAANKSVADALGTDGTTVTDAAVNVLGAIGPNNANNAFSSSSVVANNDGSVMERLEFLSDGAWRLATATSTSALTTGTIFSYTGSIEFKIIGRVSTVIQSQATTVKLGVVSDGFALYDICGTVDINAFTAGSLISITGTAAGGAVSTTSVGAIAPFQANTVLATCVTSGVIRATFGAASTGAIVWQMIWRPISTGATVT